ncbi:MAG: hypothetical protein A2X94_15795 [Bdellovibrionales bacterium GWB1_55_8]|nr:MAG: hypothetical protein A2X94_15795 [Bdellovibrionales bacterium GWB1_55_8]
MRSSKLISFFPALAATVLLSACGNLSVPSVKKVPAGSYVTGPLVSADSPTTDDGFTCPSKPNVVPDYDWSFDDSGQYTVCQKRESRADIKIHGTTSDSNTICIFPVQYVDDEHIYTKPDLTTGAPLAQCIQISPAGVFANFPDINFNAVFIVEKPYLAQMKTCLAAGNYYGCPAYSYGVFR